MGKIYDVVAVTGKYTNANGEERKRYLNVGAVIEGQYGPSLAMDPHINLAGLPRDGERVFLSLFTPGQQQAPQQNQQQMPQQNQQYAPQQPVQGQPNNKVPGF